VCIWSFSMYTNNVEFCFSFLNHQQFSKMYLLYNLHFFVPLLSLYRRILSIICVFNNSLVSYARPRVSSSIIRLCENYWKQLWLNDCIMLVAFLYLLICFMTCSFKIMFPWTTGNLDFSVHHRSLCAQADMPNSFHFCFLS